MTVDVKRIGARVDAESAFIEKLLGQIRQRVVGQDHLVKTLANGLLSNGHILLEGVPGLAKTLSVRTLADAIRADFQRIQFTPDLLPADLIGTLIYNPASGQFTTRKGPIFANVILADEINRAPAKVQSALLEAMQERQVTLAEQTFELEDPFWVLATQNPVEQEGVYTLPEAQLDRFSMMLKVTYPSEADEIEMLRTGSDRVKLQRCLEPDDVPRIRDFICNEVYVDDAIREYIVRLGHATRRPEDVGRPALRQLLTLGISPRACQHVLAVARTAAFLLHGRRYVLPGDVKEVFADVAGHRVLRSIRAEAESIGTDEILGELLTAVQLP